MGDVVRVPFGELTREAREIRVVWRLYSALLFLGFVFYVPLLWWRLRKCECCRADIFDSLRVVFRGWVVDFRTRFRRLYVENGWRVRDIEAAVGPPPDTQ